MSVKVIPAESCVEVRDLGVTLRTLLAAAAEGQRVNPKRDWKIRYKFVNIGSVRVRPINGEENARSENSTVNRNRNRNTEKG